MARDDLKQTKQVMGALVRMPPKPHEQMKLGKRKGKSSKSPARKRVEKKQTP